MPAQCTLWDNVLIGRDPPTAEVMLSLLRKVRGGWGLEVGGWMYPNRFKKGKNIKFSFYLLEPICLQKIRKLVVTRKGILIAITTLALRENCKKKTSVYQI